VANSGPLIYIYDDVGPDYNDIGFQPTDCPQGTVKVCSTSFRVSNGGFFRWQLMVESPRGNRTHAAASINVSAPFPLREVADGGFVVGSDHFLGYTPIQPESARDLEISCTNDSGSVRLLSSPTLIKTNDDWPVVATTRGSYLIESKLLTPGLHRIELVSCNWKASTCSNRMDAERAAVAGQVHPEPAGESGLPRVAAF